MTSSVWPFLINVFLLFFCVCCCFSTYLLLSALHDFILFFYSFSWAFMQTCLLMTLTHILFTCIHTQPCSWLFCFAPSVRALCKLYLYGTFRNKVILINITGPSCTLHIAALLHCLKLLTLVITCCEEEHQARCWLSKKKKNVTKCSVVETKEEGKMQYQHILNVLLHSMKREQLMYRIHN